MWFVVVCVFPLIMILNIVRYHYISFLHNTQFVCDLISTSNSKNVFDIEEYLFFKIKIV